MIRPLNDNVLIKKENLENKTASGIILSTNENKQENIGVVVAKIRLYGEGVGGSVKGSIKVKIAVLIV